MSEVKKSEGDFIELTVGDYKKLILCAKTCKDDYWFMINLLEKYSSDKEQAIQDCVDRMKFRKPIFNILDNLK